MWTATEFKKIEITLKKMTIFMEKYFFIKDVGVRSISNAGNPHNTVEMVPACEGVQNGLYITKVVARTPGKPLTVAVEQLVSDVERPAIGRVNLKGADIQCRTRDIINGVSGC